MKECIAFITDHWKLEQAETAYRVSNGQAGGKGVFTFSNGRPPPWVRDEPAS